ncbi:MAG: hypothetical protein KatS3mg110_2158 [Pirellulaceae bacterium]|nr:MAG: hypothetical protein KatS3mg110_2158 [Pirellulaceae bacterium]
MLLCLGFSLALLAGCNRQTGPKVYPVSGQVTMNGQPVTDVVVNFMPVDNDPAKMASGQVDSSGNYQLRSGSQGSPGAQPGRYKVYLTPVAPVPTEGQSYGGQNPAAGGQSAGPPTAGSNLPQPWLSAATTPLEVEVKPESNTINIDVK